MSTETTIPCEGICGPATVAVADPPLPDECIDLGNGVGQTRWHLMPCDPTGPTSGEPVVLVTRTPVLPTTGDDRTADLLAVGVLFVVAGAALLHLKRRNR